MINFSQISSRYRGGPSPQAFVAFCSFFPTSGILKVAFYEVTFVLEISRRIHCLIKSQCVEILYEVATKILYDFMKSHFMKSHLY